MARLFVVSEHEFPMTLRGSHLGYELRTLQQDELVSIEDQFFKQDEERILPKNANVAIFPNMTVTPDTIPELRTLAEFAMSLLTTEGYPSFNIVAAFENDYCESVTGLATGHDYIVPPKFITSIDGHVAAQWLRKCALAQKTLKARMHITANRYVRYARSTNLSDRLLDLCISLESLIDSQTEVSFRFGVCLAKVVGDKAEAASTNAKLLSDLYTIRSKLAHGDPNAAQLLVKFEPKLHELHKLVTRILTTFVFFMSDHSLKEWKEHVHKSIFM